MRRRARNRKSSRSKAKLGLPDLEHAKSAVIVSLRSPESQRSYRRSINDFVSWYCSEPRLSFNKTVVTRYRIYLEARLLAPGTINVRLAAVRRLAYEAADIGLLSPELAAGSSLVSFAPCLVCVFSQIAHKGKKRRRLANEQSHVRKELERSHRCSLCLRGTNDRTTWKLATQERAWLRHDQIGLESLSAERRRIKVGEGQAIRRIG